MGKHTMTWVSTRSAPCAVCPSFSARPMEAETPAESPPPPGDVTWQASCWLACTRGPRGCPHPGGCARRQPRPVALPGKCQAPAVPSAAGGQGWQPFPSGGPASPLQRGRRPQRGLGSFDYLIAADTNPIFLLFQSSQLSQHFHSGPVTGAPAGGLRAERQPRGERACRRWCRPGPRAPAFVSTRAPPSP